VPTQSHFAGFSLPKAIDTKIQWATLHNIEAACEARTAVPWSRLRKSGIFGNSLTSEKGDPSNRPVRSASQGLPTEHCATPVKQTSIQRIALLRRRYIFARAFRDPGCSSCADAKRRTAARGSSTAPVIELLDPVRCGLCYSRGAWSARCEDISEACQCQTISQSVELGRRKWYDNACCCRVWNVAGIFHNDRLHYGTSKYVQLVCVLPAQSQRRV
jgi:hypothetical protein